MACVICGCRGSQRGSYSLTVPRNAGNESISHSFPEHLSSFSIYSGTSLIQTPMGQKKVSLLVRCPHFRC